MALQNFSRTISTSDTGPKLVTKMSVFTSVTPPATETNMYEKTKWKMCLFGVFFFLMNDVREENGDGFPVI